jgi:hypothetical protein
VGLCSFVYRGINFVHGGEIFHVSKEDSGFDNFVKTGACRLKDLDYVEEDLSGFSFHTAFSKFTYFYKMMSLVWIVCIFLRLASTPTWPEV